MTNQPAASVPESEYLTELPGAGQTRCFALRGRIGTAEATDLRQALLPLGAHLGDVELHCGDLEHLGGAALQVLLSLRAGLGGAERNATLVNLPPPIARSLAQAGIGVDLRAL